MKKNLSFTLLIFTFFHFISFAQKSENETIARQWISAYSQKLDIQPFHDFKLTFVRKSLSGETLRFQQMLNNVMVYDAEIVIQFNLQNEISFSSNNYDKTIANISTIPAVSQKDAILFSNGNTNTTNGRFLDQKIRLVVFNHNEMTKLAYRITTQISNKAGDWETFIDAKSGQLLLLNNIAIDYYSATVKNHNKKTRSKSIKNTPSVFVPATAMIFDFDPLSAAQVLYETGTICR